MATTTLYDDTYTGRRWRYGMTHRPPMLGTVPAGRIVGADRPDNYGPTWPFGTVDFPRPLTAHEVYAYELIELPDTSPDDRPREEARA